MDIAGRFGTARGQRVHPLFTAPTTRRHTVVGISHAPAGLTRESIVRRRPIPSTMPSSKSWSRRSCLSGS